MRSRWAITASAVSLALPSSDGSWHPVIEVRLAKASDVAALEDENARLRRERDYLRSQYMNECEINLRLEDILREHGISPKG